MTRRNLWGGRFQTATDERFQRFNDSFAFDHELLEDDIEASIAWAESLREAGVLDQAEMETIQEALAEIRDESREAELPLDQHEDVHSYVESALRDKLGEFAGKLHTGRSRNDQVATDLRLFLRRAMTEVRDATLDLAGGLAARAEKEAGTAMPGYTHLRQAEPITFGHWCLAYAEMLLRDASRLADALERADECPLGSGALAGTPLRIDREALARRLGFERPSANSLDAVSDRDAAAEFLFCGNMLLIHLSRLGEDLIFYSSDQVGFVELPDALATGSSRMPQKKNPDLLELARGHAGRSIGELMGLLALLKGLPLAYNKDLQLDKEPLFRLRATLSMLLPLITQLIHDLRLDRTAMEEAASSEALLATHKSDLLAARGVPFRQAHEIVGRDLAGQSRATIAESEEPSVGDVLDQKSSIGGTAPHRVESSARQMRERIASMRGGHDAMARIGP